MICARDTRHPNLNTYYAPLQQDALLHLTGPDALQFLQGQVTCDTRNVDETHATLGAYCTPQGRVVCDFLLCQLAHEHLALRMRRDLREHSAAIFGKYIIFSKAELQPQRDDWVSVGCWGEQVSTVLQGIFGELPKQRHESRVGPGFAVIQVDDQGQQFECYLDTQGYPQLEEQLAAAMHCADEEHWQALQIEAGIGRVENGTTEEFVPQMLNFDHTGHISFKKGCYTGQEVVARLHYRGKPKRRMYRVILNETAAAGTPVYAAEGGQSVGNIVNCVSIDPSGATALAVLTVSRVEEDLRVGSDQGTQVKLTTLPYAIEEPE